MYPLNMLVYSEKLMKSTVTGTSESNTMSLTINVDIYCCKY